MTAPPVIKPARLRRGDTIGLVTPGRAAQFPRRLERGVRELRRMGFDVRFGRHALSADQTDAERVSDIHEMFLDPSIRAIFLTLAGEAPIINRLLQLIDFDLIRRHPKILVGQSAATTLIMAIHQRTGIVTFHGPCVVQHFGNVEGTDEATEASLLAVVGGEVVGYAAAATYSDEYRDWDFEDGPRVFLTGTPWQSLVSGSAQGRLLGGSLRGVVRNLESPFALDYTGAIAFWDLPFSPVEPPDPGEVRRLLHTIEKHRVFQDMAGMAVGKPYLYKARDGALPPFDDLVADAVAGGKKPVLSGIDCGHTLPMLTLPLGTIGEIDGEKCLLRMVDHAVE